jgi:hypothetical protein
VLDGDNDDKTGVCDDDHHRTGAVILRGTSPNTATLAHKGTHAWRRQHLGQAWETLGSVGHLLLQGSVFLQNSRIGTKHGVPRHSRILAPNTVVHSLLATAYSWHHMDLHSTMHP